MKKKEEKIENIIDNTADLPETRAFTDDADIARHINAIHERKKFDLDENYIQMKADGTEKEQEYIRKQHLNAIKMYHLIPDKQIAEQAFNIIMTEPRDLALMGRNRKGNMLLEGLMNRGTPSQQIEKLLNGNTETEKASLSKKVKTFLFKNKKPTREDDEIV